MSYIDTRDLDERLTELEERDNAECDDCFGCVRSINDTRQTLPTDCRPDPLDDDEVSELDALRELRDAIGDEWSYGATLIPESEFADYAREFAEDIGIFSVPVYSIYSQERQDISGQWLFTCIDWEQAADELRSDYSTVTFDGTDYLVRL